MVHLEVLSFKNVSDIVLGIAKRPCGPSGGSAASTAQTLTAYLLTGSSMQASAKRVWTPSDVDDFLSTSKNRLLHRSRGGDVGMKDVGPYMLIDVWTIRLNLNGFMSNLSMR